MKREIVITQEEAEVIQHINEKLDRIIKLIEKKEVPDAEKFIQRMNEDFIKNKSK